VWVFASFDPVPRLDFRRYVRLRDATVARDVAWFGSRDRGRGIFAPGTGPSVVGRAVAGLPADPPVRARAELDDAHAFTSIPAGAAHLPGLVSGRISPGLSTGPRLAVAINGRVAAVTLRSDGKEGTDEFEAIVDPRTLRAGANDVSVYVLRQRGGAFRLAPLAQQAGETYRLVTRGERQLIVDSTGRRRVVSDLVQGSVDSLALEDDVLRALGWAAQPRLGPAEKVLVFVDGRFQAAAVPSKPRPDVAREHGRSTLASGFSIAGSAPAGATRQDVRVFALRGARASELPR
jgi:hypothetical protein